MIPPPGTIGIMKMDPASRISRFVFRCQKWLGASPEVAQYTHVYLVGDDGDVWESQPGEGWVVGTWEPTDREEILVQVPGLSEVDMERMFHRAEWMLQEQVKYSKLIYAVHLLDCLGLPSEWLAEHIRRSGRVNCAMAIMELLQKAAGRSIVGIGDPLRTVPCDFYAAYLRGDLFRVNEEKVVAV